MIRRLAIAAFVALLAMVAGGCGGSDPGEDGPVLGYNDLLQPDEPGNELLADSGATVVRRPLNWAAVEPNPGERNWEPIDQIADELEAQGVEPLWVLTSAPCWAAADPDCTPNTPSFAPARKNFSDYADFAAEVAERYPDAAGIEVWNEPNLEIFFVGGGDASFYAEMLEQTDDAIERTGTDVPVVVAGLSPVPEDSPVRSEWTGYLAEVLEAGGGEHADALGLHPYSAFEPETGTVETAKRMIGEAEETLEGADAELPIWVTEVGASTSGRAPVSESEQADELETLYELIDDQGIAMMVVHRLFDQRDPEFPIEKGYGVIEADRSTPKPSYCRLAGLAGEPCE